MPLPARRTLKLVGPPYMHGPDVLLVQRHIGSKKKDGHFGPRTRRGVIFWQRHHGLHADGIVGSRTWLRLLATPIPDPVPGGPPVTTAPLFADLSGYNLDVDLPAYKRAGYSLIVIKLTEGDDFQSSSGIARWRKAGELGLLRVAYHFCRPSSNSAKAEAQWFEKIVRQAGWRRGDGVMCDWEDEHFDGPRSSGDAWTREWGGRTHDRLGARSILYSYGSYLAETVSAIDAAFGCYHHAAYNSNPEASVPAFARPLLGAVQYTNGIDGASPHYLPGCGTLGGSKHCDVSRLKVSQARYVGGVR